LANLVANAARYTDRGGDIGVRVWREAGDVVIGVRDSGIGIRREQLKAIFEPFSEGGRTAERYGGLGLGLTLAKSFVEKHGGSVSAMSRGPGRGSEFRVRLPVGAPGAVVAPPAHAERPIQAERPRVHASTARRILIVDDNHDAAVGLARAMTLLGHDVVIARDRAQAVERAAQRQFDVVILDLDVPAVDGYEVVRRIRAEAGNATPRFVAVTGFGTEDDRARTRVAGFAAHLVKPIDHRVLLEVIAHTPPARLN
jgi:CheY-like chemotaxis protein